MHAVPRNEDQCIRATQGDVSVRFQQREAVLWWPHSSSGASILPKHGMRDGLARGLGQNLRIHGLAPWCCKPVHI